MSLWLFLWFFFAIKYKNSTTEKSLSEWVKSIWIRSINNERRGGRPQTRESNKMMSLFFSCVLFVCPVYIQTTYRQNITLTVYPIQSRATMRFDHHEINQSQNNNQQKKSSKQWRRIHVLFFRVSICNCLRVKNIIVRLFWKWGKI